MTTIREAMIRAVELMDKNNQVERPLKYFLNESEFTFADKNGLIVRVAGKPYMKSAIFPYGLCEVLIPEKLSSKSF